MLKLINFHQELEGAWKSYGFLVDQNNMFVANGVDGAAASNCAVLKVDETGNSPTYKVTQETHFNADSLSLAQ